MITHLISKRNWIMIPNKEEQENKLEQIYKELIKENLYEIDSYEFMEVGTIIYAKWYVTEIIKYCAEVAKGSLKFSNENGVDKQSILNVINEL